MRRYFPISTLGVLSLAAIVAFVCVGYVMAGGVEKLELKAGQKYFVANCGKEYRCNAVSTIPGKCPCGKDMVEATAVKVDPIRTWRIPVTVEGGTARFKAEGWATEREFDIIAKYRCATGRCKMISQIPGKCACGEDMKASKVPELVPS